MNRRLAHIGATLAVAALLLAGCGSSDPLRDRPRRQPAPIRIASGPPLAWQMADVSPGPNPRIYRSASQHYAVRAGDTLWAIAVVHGIELEDLAAWNGVDDPDMLFLGQRLRLSPPDGSGESRPESGQTAPTGPVATTPAAAPQVPPPTATVQIAPAPPTPESPAAQSPAQPSMTVAAVIQHPLPPPWRRIEPQPRARFPRSEPPPTAYPTASRPAPNPATAASPGPIDGGPHAWVIRAAAPSKWLWPARGEIVSRFTTSGQVRNNGIDIALDVGTPVTAAALGVVAYADNRLPGYGNMIILRHGGHFMTAYAHNSRILVQRGERVSAGQIIAYSGQSGRAATPRLHFELRKSINPVNPLIHLPRL